MRVENLSVKYGEISALDNVNLEFDTSKITAVIGTNGSGKSTLFRVLAGIEKPSSGLVKSDFSNTSLLLPDSVLLKRSVRENFKFALKASGVMSEFDERVGEALGLVGLDEGFLDKPYYALSSGQSKRVAFGVVLALRKRVLLLDEPTNSLDESSKELFSRAIKYIHEKYKCGFIISSHDEKWLSKIALEKVILYRGKVAKFEMINRFEVKDSCIDFGSGVMLRVPSSDFTNIAINPHKIHISKVPFAGSSESFAHSVSLVYGSSYLVKIKFGDRLLRAYLDEKFEVGQRVYFKIDDSAFAQI